MVNDKERVTKADSYHMFIAIRRKKENRDKKEMVFRQIIQDEQTDIDILRTKFRKYPGKWRVYHTVNPREKNKAVWETFKYLIDNPNNTYKTESLIKSFMMKPFCKQGRRLLIDIDGDWLESLSAKKSVKFVVGNKVVDDISTPNGFHIITENFDTTQLDNIVQEERNLIEVKRDAYYLYDIIHIV